MLLIRQHTALDMCVCKADKRADGSCKLSHQLQDCWGFNMQRPPGYLSRLLLALVIGGRETAFLLGMGG